MSVGKALSLQFSLEHPKGSLASVEMLVKASGLERMAKRFLLESETMLEMTLYHPLMFT